MDTARQAAACRNDCNRLMLCGQLWPDIRMNLCRQGLPETIEKVEMMPFGLTWLQIGQRRLTALRNRGIWLK